MTAVVVVCGVLLTVGALLAIIRAEKGPSMLDRTIALDIVVTAMIAAVALYAAVERRTDVVPMLVVLSLVGFVGSVTIARFASVEPEGEGRVRTREEIAAEALRLAEEEDRLQDEADEDAEVDRQAEADAEGEPEGDDQEKVEAEEHGGGAEGEVR